MKRRGGDFLKLNQFGAVRVLAGLALLYFFVSLGSGDLTISVASADQGFPSPLLLRWCSRIGLISCILFICGSLSRFAAVACLACLNASLFVLPVIAEIHYPYLSLILGTYAIFGSQPWRAWRPLGLRDELREREIWYLPLLYSVFLGFTFLGVYKFFFPPWWDGEVVRLLCPKGPLGSAFPPACDWLPRRWIAYYVLFAEASSFPLALHPRTRPLAWLLNVVLQLGISQFIFLRRITYVVLVTLLFLFDSRWLQQSVRPKSTVREPSR